MENQHRPVCPIPQLGYCIYERCNFWDEERQECSGLCFGDYKSFGGGHFALPRQPLHHPLDRGLCTEQARAGMKKHFPEFDPTWIERLIDLALEEDLGTGDVTTPGPDSPGPAGRGPHPGQAGPGGGGLAVAALVFRKVDSAWYLNPRSRKAQEVAPGTVLARVTGPVAAILTGERTALNFLQRLSGIATLPGKMVNVWLPAPTRPWWTPARPPRAGGGWRNTPCVGRRRQPSGRSLRWRPHQEQPHHRRRLHHRPSNRPGKRPTTS